MEALMALLATERPLGETRASFSLLPLERSRDQLLLLLHSASLLSNSKERLVALYLLFQQTGTQEWHEPFTRRVRA